MIPRLLAAFVGLCCAASAAHAFKGQCVLDVKGVSYINGPCDILIEPGGSFEIDELRRGPHYFAQVDMEDDGTASGHWNANRDYDHAQTYLGTVVRQGACWTNDTTKICAWRSGTRAR